MYLKNARFYHIYANKNRYDYEKEKDVTAEKGQKQGAPIPSTQGKIFNLCSSLWAIFPVGQAGGTSGKAHHRCSSVHT